MLDSETLCGELSGGLTILAAIVRPRGYNTPQ